MTSALFDSGRSAPAAFGARQEILSGVSARTELLAAVLVNMHDVMYSTKHAEEPQDKPKFGQFYTKLNGDMSHSTIVFSMLFVCNLTSLSVTIKF